MTSFVEIGDAYRVYLEETGTFRNDYINAVFVNVSNIINWLIFMIKH